MSSPKNVISWFEIPVTDMARAKSFYETILDMSMSELSLTDTFKMAFFPQQEEGSVGGALVLNKEQYVPDDSKGCLLYLDANPDLKIVENRIEDAGGSVVISKRPIGNGSFMALFVDTEGNRMALYSGS